MAKTYGMICEANGERGFTRYSLLLTREDAFLVSNLRSDRIGKVITLSGGRTMTKKSATEIYYEDPKSEGSGRDATLIAASMRESLDDIIEQSRSDRDDAEDD